MAAVGFSAVVGGWAAVFFLCLTEEKLLVRFYFCSFVGSFM